MLGRPRPLWSRAALWPVLVTLLLAGGAACGRTGGDGTTGVKPRGSATVPRATITVLAAASLTDAFTQLGQAFEAARPGTKVVFSFGASSALATQANEGAPADLMASADEANLEKVVDAGNASMPSVFARNRLAILVARGNPKGIRALPDLARPGVDFVLCAPEVPCGKFGAQALGKAGVTAPPRSYEENVKAVVTKVTLGEADAGIVYVTDVKGAGGRAEGVDIPDAQNVVAVYPMAVLRQSGRPELARAFLDYVLSPAGQQVLARHGFLPA
jgi:molybdate transport system substrate-binding protein